MTHNRFGWVSLLVTVSLLLNVGGAVMAQAPADPAVPSAGRVAYIYSTDTASRDSFNTMLTGKGIQVDLVPLSQVLQANFSVDQAIIIGDDTGTGGTWANVDIAGRVRAAGKPIVGIGEGGSSFFSMISIFINYGQSWFDSDSGAYATYPADSFWSTPTVITIPGNRVVQFYTSTVSMLAVYNPTPVAGVHRLGRQTGDPSHYPLISQNAQGQCFTLWGFRSAPLAMTPTGQNVFVNTVLGNPCTYTLASTYAPTPPVIDGKLDWGEWPMVDQLPFNHGFLTAVNDGVRLYLLMDVTGDTTDDPPLSSAPWGDYFWLTFDVDRNGSVTPNTDLLYGTHGNYNMRYAFFLGPGTTTGLQPSTRSSLGPGFGCFFGDGSLFITIHPFHSSCSNHRVWEFGIDLREINAQPGGTVRMGLRSYSQTPSFTDDVPANPDADFSNLIQISLASLPSPLPASNPNALVSLQAQPLELTQAIQDLSNSQPLVADKASVARLYAQTTGAASGEPAIAYLYGSNGGLDLPGSPLAQLITAPTAPDRNQLNKSGNFLLPKSWDSAGAVTFQPAVAKLTGSPTFGPLANLTFQTRRTPLYWVIPINMGTSGSPQLIDSSLIASQESYLKAVYPVPDARFVQKPWQAIGAVGNDTIDDTITRLNTYYNSAVIAWIFSVLFTGKSPYDLPDLIYGFRITGGGLSDPVWYNSGAGRVAAGFLGTSLEGTMAHEFNHDLDRKVNATWGLHVGGCGADGPHFDWPYSDFRIHEIGFDTRLPWSNGSGGRDTVIPSSYPDFMSYCQSGRSPTKWISPYRWQHLFGEAFASPAAPMGAAAGIQALSVITDVYYLSGRVTVTGTGSLDPIFIQPGIPSANPLTGTYSIELQNGSGTPLQTLLFPISFTDPEGNPHDTAFFNFQMPKQAGVSRAVLKNGTNVLATLIAASTPPTVTVTQPTAGQTLSGVTTVQWSASGSGSLTFMLFYTPDNGATWLPVASGLTGNSYNVNLALLPSGSQARFRVVVSDGFNTAQNDSATFTVTGGGLPTVSILSPQPGAKVPSGVPINFQGDAHDSLGNAIPDNQIVWSYAPTGGLAPQSVTAATNFGSGRQVSVALPDGAYDITMTAVDGTGNTNSTTINVLINLNRLYLPSILR